MMLPVVLSMFQSPDNVVLAAGDPPSKPRSSSEAPARNPQLRDELLGMLQADQAARQPGHIDAKAMLAADTKNLARLKQIIQEHGFPTISLVGTDGALATWLLAQHADSDPEFQKSVLAMMEPLVKAGEASATHFAYLYDRTHTPQRYGTQGRCVAKSVWAPRDIEDPEHVDQRRATVGLPPLSEYIASIETAEGLCSAADPAPPAASGGRK